VVELFCERSPLAHTLFLVIDARTTYRIYEIWIMRMMTYGILYRFRTIYDMCQFKLLACFVVRLIGSTLKYGYGLLIGRALRSSFIDLTFPGCLVSAMPFRPEPTRSLPFDRMVPRRDNLLSLEEYKYFDI